MTFLKLFLELKQLIHLLVDWQEKYLAATKNGKKNTVPAS